MSKHVHPCRRELVSHVRVHVCVSASVHVCVCVCFCVYVYIYIHVGVQRGSNSCVTELG